MAPLQYRLLFCMAKAVIASVFLDKMGDDVSSGRRE